MAQGVGETLLRIADTHPVSDWGAGDVETALKALRFLRGLHQDLRKVAETRLAEGVEAKRFVAEFSEYVEILGRFVAPFSRSVEALGPEESADPALAEFASESRGLLEEAREQYERLASILAKAQAGAPPGFWDRAGRLRSSTANPATGGSTRPKK